MALVMPKRFVQEFGLLPLRVAGSRILYLAFEDGLNAGAALALEQMSELRVESGLILLRPNTALCLEPIANAAASIRALRLQSLLQLLIGDPALRKQHQPQRNSVSMRRPCD